MKLVTLILLIAVFPLSLAAQTLANKQQEEMKKLGFLVGKWQGEGWIQQGSKRETFALTEEVQLKLGGLAILLEGIGKSKNAEAAGKIVHHVMAVVSVDPAGSNFLWRMYTKDGFSLDVPARLTGEKSVECRVTLPQGGSIRYTIKLDSQDKWTEAGEFSPDGTNWIKNFEMTMQRVK